MIRRDLNQLNLTDLHNTLILWPIFGLSFFIYVQIFLDGKKLWFEHYFLIHTKRRLMTLVIHQQLPT